MFAAAQPPLPRAGPSKPSTELRPRGPGGCVSPDPPLVLHVADLRANREISHVPQGTPAYGRTKGKSASPGVSAWCYDNGESAGMYRVTACSEVRTWGSGLVGHLPKFTGPAACPGPRCVVRCARHRLRQNPRASAFCESLVFWE